MRSDRAYVEAITAAEDSLKEYGFAMTAAEKIQLDHQFSFQNALADAPR